MRRSLIAAVAALFLIPLLAGCAGSCRVPRQAEAETPAKGNDMDRKYTSIEAACGQCQFGLPGEGCDLAVRIEGEAYFVDGSGIDDHGDAHAADGLCNAIRRADAAGRIEKGRFVASSISLNDSD